MISGSQELQLDVTPEDIASSRQELMRVRNAYVDAEAAIYCGMGASTASPKARFATKRAIGALKLLTDQEHQPKIHWDICFDVSLAQCVTKLMVTFYFSSRHRSNHE